MLWAFPIHAQVDVFDVQNDVRHVPEHTWQRRKLVKYPFDLHRDDCRTLQRRQQDPAQRIPERQPKPRSSGTSTTDYFLAQIVRGSAGGCLPRQERGVN
jgi:hypothetical protein